MSDDEENKRPAVAEPDAQDAVAMPPVPSEGTTAALAYVTAVNADLRFFDFIIRTTLNQDYMRYVAKQTLDGKTPHHNDPTHLATTAPGPSVRFLRENSQALLEMFVARLVDNFQKYLVDAIREILRSKPAMLSTTKQSITLEELLKYERITDIVHDVIERKVHSLSYEGFSALQKWCEEKGIQIKVPTARVLAVVEVIATRNIIAHNRGLVDERYIRAVRTSSFKIGNSRILDADDLFRAHALLNEVVFETDKAARNRFALFSRSCG